MVSMSRAAGMAAAGTLGNAARTDVASRMPGAASTTVGKGVPHDVVKNAGLVPAAHTRRDTLVALSDWFVARGGL